MKSNYIQSTFQVESEQSDILLALLSNLGYEAFEEEENSLKAFIQGEEGFMNQLDDSIMNLPLSGLKWKHEAIPPTNWNKEWEKNYQPIEVGKFCQIVPSFHEPKANFQYTIRLDPKMAFGTGHHQTTRLMIRQLSSMEVSGESLLDMGSGTGILAILARKMGAGSVWAIDIDPWSQENTQENSNLNRVDGIEIVLGDRDAIPPVQFKTILANINRNVLLADIPTYTQHLSDDGTLVISGIYQRDLPLFEEVFEKCKLRPHSLLQEDEWVSLQLVQEGRTV